MRALRTLGAAGLLLTSGCLLELDSDIACGDGYIDQAAGEECEPDVERSFRDACRTELGINKPGACSTLSCTVDLSACFPACGNGVLDGNEECDPGTPLPPSSDSEEPSDDEPDDQIGTQLSCTLVAPNDGGGPYAGGILGDCNDDCTWDRTPCHRCGDGELQAGEVCDGDRGSFDDVDQTCLSACVDPNQDPRPARVVCSARCSDACEYVVDAADKGCCIPTGLPVDPHIECCGYEDNGQCKLGLGE